jgi:arylsulfatase A-like enzyme
MLKVITLILLFAVCTSQVACASNKDVAKGENGNILLLIIDDLRPQLGCYGNSEILSPHIDKLANEGIIFNRAICNFPVCGPSRASLLSGVRPHEDRFTGNHALVAKEMPGAITINTFYKENGYETVSLGKVFHNRKDNKDGWTIKPWAAGDNDPKKKITGWRDYITPENQELCKTNEKKAALPYEIADVEDDAYYDGKVAQKAIEYLNSFKNEKKKFFMTVGFVKPHLPFNAPKKYYDLYPLKDISLPDNYFLPKNAPEEANNMWWEMRAYHGISKSGPVSNDIAKKLIRGYRACTSYADAMVGKVLDSLKELGLDNNTTVVLIGDHGWHLGEHTLWAKHSNFEKTLRTAMIIKTPGIKKHQKINSPTELVDIYPTLCELMGYKAPEHLEGKSMVPLMVNPDAEWKSAVYSKYNNAWSVLTDRYLYTEWKDKNGKAVANMLYDHKIDPDENINIAKDSEVSDIVERHKLLLEQYYNCSVK